MNRTSTLHRLRTAGIGLCLGGVAVSAWSTVISVRAANTGDIFIQNTGAGAPSGQDNDPKLSCADIDLWGSGLVLSTSTFTIAGSPPSGSQETVYSAGWHYSGAVADPQIVAVVPVATLIADAAAAGDTPQASNGYHFKIDFAQDSGKSKTFWIDCPAPSGDPGTGSTGSGSGTTTTTSSSTTSSSSSTTTTSTDAGTTTSGGSSTTTSDAGTTTSSADAGTTTTSGGSTTTTSTDAGTTSTGSTSTSTDAAPLTQDGSTTTSTSTSTQSSSAGTSSVDGASGVNGLSDGSATIGSLGSGATTSSSSTTTQSAPQTSSTASTTSSAAGGNIGVSITAPAPAPAPVPTSAPLLPTAASEPPAPNTGADIPFGLGLLLLVGGAGTILVSSALRRRRA